MFRAVLGLSRRHIQIRSCQATSTRVQRHVRLLSNQDKHQLEEVQKQQPIAETAAFHAALNQCKSCDDIQKVASAFASAKPKHGHAAFVNAAMDKIVELREPVETHLYNTLIDAFPEKNTFRTLSLLDAIWPRETVQTDAAIRVLQHMEDDGVVPSLETYNLCKKIFGKASQPLKKVRRMRYWMSKAIDFNPFALPLDHPVDPDSISRFVLTRITDRTDELTDLKPYLTTTKNDQQSELKSDLKPIYCQHTAFQRQLISDFAKNKAKLSLAITGPSYLYFCARKSYFLVLMGSIEEEEEILDLILGTCVFHSSQNPRDIALAWQNYMFSALEGIESFPFVIDVQPTIDNATASSFADMR